MDCKGCKEEKPCFGCEHDRRKPPEPCDKIKEILYNIQVVCNCSHMSGADLITIKANIKKLKKELSKPEHNQKSFSFKGGNNG